MWNFLSKPTVYFVTTRLAFTQRTVVLRVGVTIRQIKTSICKTFVEFKSHVQLQINITNNFLGTTKFGGAQKIAGHWPRMPPIGYGPAYNYRYKRFFN